LFALGLVACGGSPAVPASVASSVTAPAAAPTPTCVPLGTFDEDTPALVLFEHGAWEDTSDVAFPTLALWADGRLVFRSTKDREPRQARISGADAAKIIDEVSLSTRGAPTSSAAAGTFDLPPVDLVVRDDGAWRIHRVYGLGLVAGEMYSGSYAPTKELVEAYELVRALRPADGAAFEPDEIDVEYTDFTGAKGAPLPWPSDVPLPPADQDTGAEISIGGTRRLCGMYLPAVQRLATRAYASDPPHAIEHDGRRWAVLPVVRYHGQTEIEAVVTNWLRQQRITP
jgi:hypothetical protein